MAISTAVSLISAIPESFKLAEDIGRVAIPETLGLFGGVAGGIGQSIEKVGSVFGRGLKGIGEKLAISKEAEKRAEENRKNWARWLEFKKRGGTWQEWKRKGN